MADTDATTLAAGRALGDRPERLARAGVLRALNHLLRGEDWARARLAPHAGKVVQMGLEPVALRLIVEADGLLGPADPDQDADVTLVLPVTAWPDFVAGALVGDLTGAVRRKTRISGDADLAHVLSVLFEHLRWDTEEDLSQRIGDAPAHRLVTGARAVVDQLGRMRERVHGNFVEFLTEERPTLVTRHHLAGYADEVRRLREDLDRLDKRIDRLSRGRHQ